MNERLETLFHEALSLPPDQRSAFLAQACGNDAKLQGELQQMIDDADRAEAMFGGAIGRLAATITPMEGIRVGPYKLIRRIGEGGMGVVFLASRAEGDFEQQVAIKFVQGGPGLIDRFRHERRILASLTHPNIARLLDGGATADGLPYLVMEYIEGRPLIEYCRELALNTRQRLLIFEQICAAVQHAHQQLVVHRDIKPGNILVTPEGVPKLLDFGIAKLLLPDAREDLPSTLTSPGMRLLTPDYASPEQVRRDSITVASDVYSLGAVLYELLTGKRAHQLDNHSEAELNRVICERDVTPPSKAVDDTRLRKELSGELDDIVGHALRKDPARRYASVEQFAGDIRRHLENLPILARPETSFYRVRKFVTRNRVPVTAAILVLASLSAGIIATTLQAHRADAQAARAERRFQQVRKLANTFVFDIYDGMVDIPGTAQLRARVVDNALEYLDSLAKEAEGDTALQLELAAAYRRIGDVRGNPARSGLGQTSHALASYQKAAAILNRLAAHDNPDPKVLADLANLERAIGFMHLSTGDPSRALHHEQNSIAAWQRRTPQRGHDLQSDTGIAQAWGIMGKILSAQGDADAAVKHHTAAVNLLRSWIPRNPGVNTQGTIAIMLQDLGEARRDTGDLTGAVAIYREAVLTRQQLLRSDPSSMPYRRRLFSLNFALASAFGNALTFSLGDHANAERYAAEALREAEAMARDDKGSARSVRDRMFGNWIMGCVLLPTDTRRALPYLETALQIATAQAAANPGDSFYRQTEANAQEAFARAILQTAGRPRAIQLLRRAADTLHSLSQESPEILDYRSDLIRVWNTLGDILPNPASHDFYRKAWLAAQSSQSTPRNVWELFNHAAVQLRWHRWNSSAPAAERRRNLELALASWSELAAKAPASAPVQAAINEARRSLAAL